MWKAEYLLLKLSSCHYRSTQSVPDLIKWHEPKKHKFLWPNAQEDEIFLKKEIYIALEKIEKIPSPRAVLYVDPEDFIVLQNTVHPGAFGIKNTDYFFVKEKHPVVDHLGVSKLVRVVKIPADINGLYNWKVIPYPINVGSYAMKATLQDNRDVNWVQSARKFQTNIKFNDYIEKVRLDFTDERFGFDSVHYFQTPTGEMLAGIGTAYFMDNFNKPTLQETQSVISMLQKLEDKGILAFSCNQTHHAVLFYKIKETEEMITPPVLSRILKEDIEIFNVIKTAAKKGEEEYLDIWKEMYMTKFLSDSSYCPESQTPAKEEKSSTPRRSSRR